VKYSIIRDRHRNRTIRHTVTVSVVDKGLNKGTNFRGTLICIVRVSKDR
jgi:hypothetical protein